MTSLGRSCWPSRTVHRWLGPKASRGLVGVLTGASLLVAVEASAQIGGGLPGMGPSQPPPSSGGKKKGPPKTHAAPGSGEELGVLPTEEVSLPNNPLVIPPAIRTRIGSDSTEAKPRVKGKKKRRWYGLYYEESQGEERFRTLFPFWLERKRGSDDTSSLFGGIYYRRRSPKRNDDIVFPFYWDVQQGQTRTHVVGPVVWRRGPKHQDNWLVPFVFQGKTPTSSYLHIPPLLTFTHHDQTSGFNMVGPAFCSWKNGGSTCSTRTATDIDFGIAPFYFYGRSENSEYELIPPLLHYYRYTEVGEKSLNIWGPLLWKHDRKGDVFDVLPLFFHVWGKDEDHVTLLPFFHYGHKGNANLLVTPLFLTATGEHGEKTFVTWGYARYRGRTHLDMITPFYWHYEDPDIGDKTTIIPPLFYRSTGVRHSDLAIFPFYGHFHRFGVKETTWVTPFFQHSHGLTGWETNIHPLIYIGRNQNESHTVVFPFFWDFASPTSRSTVVFPVYWRFDSGSTVSQLVLNTYYHQRKLRGGLDWEFHFFPLFSYGERPDGHWWKLLYGLAGYQRRGNMTKIYAGWVPITLTGKER